MMRCQECGHDNEIGTLFCHACGAQLDIHYDQIQQSVIAGNADAKDKKIFDAGRSTLNLGMILFLIAAVFYFALVPDMPPQRYPAFPPTAMEEIFTASEHWSSTIKNDGSAETMVEDRDQPLDLIAWRRHEADLVLGQTVGELRNIYNHSAMIANMRDREDGLWHTGEDVLAASGLALLAIQAYAYPADSRSSSEKARLLTKITDKALAALERKVLDTNRSTLGRSLALMALVEGGVLDDDELADARAVFIKGDHPEWHSLALMTIPPGQRPDLIAALRRQVDGKDVWEHLLDPYSDKPIVDEVPGELFEEAFVDQLGPLDRVAWSNIAWRYGVAPKLLKRKLKAWSEVDPPPQGPPELRSLAGGELADRALLVLACSAPLRVPVIWLQDRRDDR